MRARARRSWRQLQVAEAVAVDLTFADDPCRPTTGGGSGGATLLAVWLTPAAPASPCRTRGGWVALQCNCISHSPQQEGE